MTNHTAATPTDSPIGLPNPAYATSPQQTATNSFGMGRDAEQLYHLRDLLLAKAPTVDPEQIQYVRSPLRICPLGAHIDHQLGVVTGMTIDRAITLAFAPAADSNVSLYSTDFDTPVTFDLHAPPPFVAGDWGNYARGAVVALSQKLPLTQGIVGVVGGSMPIGGLSSSAAVTIAYLLALEAIHGGILDPADNVQLCRATENSYIGLNNGILDQSVILYNQHERLTRIDCLTMQVDQVIAPSAMHADYEIMVVYSGVGKALVGTDYNRRVAECREAAEGLLTAAGHSHRIEGATRLRHVEPEIFAEFGEQLPAPLYRRARHFFGEMARVEAGTAAWQAGDLQQFGALMTESGASSIQWYESGSPPLITLYDALCNAPGVYGARFSGAGFRGNCIALVDPRQRDAAAEAVGSRYRQNHPDYADAFSVHFCRPGAGAMVLDGELLPIVV
ncbi:MAG: galactokinase family protein [Litorilinea sp.]